MTQKNEMHGEKTRWSLKTVAAIVVVCVIPLTVYVQGMAHDIKDMSKDMAEIKKKVFSTTAMQTWTRDLQIKNPQLNVPLVSTQADEMAKHE